MPAPWTNRKDKARTQAARKKLEDARKQKEEDEAEVVSTPSLDALWACAKRSFAELVQEELEGTKAINPNEQAKVIRKHFFACTLPIISCGYGDQAWFMETLNHPTKPRVVAGYIVMHPVTQKPLRVFLNPALGAKECEVLELQTILHEYAVHGSTGVDKVFHEEIDGGHDSEFELRADLITEKSGIKVYVRFPEEQGEVLERWMRAVPYKPEWNNSHWLRYWKKIRAEAAGEPPKKSTGKALIAFAEGAKKKLYQWCSRPWPRKASGFGTDAESSAESSDEEEERGKAQRAKRYTKSPTRKSTGRKRKGKKSASKN